MRAKRVAVNALEWRNGYTRWRNLYGTTVLNHVELLEDLKAASGDLSGSRSSGQSENHWI